MDSGQVLEEHMEPAILLWPCLEIESAAVACVIGPELLLCPHRFSPGNVLLWPHVGETLRQTPALAGPSASPPFPACCLRALPAVSMLLLNVTFSTKPTLTTLIPFS